VRVYERDNLIKKANGNISHKTPSLRRALSFFCCFAATQLARQVQQERTQVVCSNKEARKRLARRHSRNGPWTHECCLEVLVMYVRIIGDHY